MDKLPIGYYTVNPDAKNLYKIVEVIPPRGYSLYPQEEKNTAYIPNIDYLNLSSNEVVSKAQCRQPGYHLSNLQFGRKYVYLCLDILGYQDTYDHEELGRRKDTRFC